MGELVLLMDIQDKKAFQAQPHMTAVKCRKLFRSSRKGARYVKNVGLGFKTPKTAIEGKYIDKNNRYEKRHKMVSAHCSPAFDARIGDEVVLGQCRPLSKTVIFNVVKLNELAARTSGVKTAN